MAKSKLKKVKKKSKENVETQEVIEEQVQEIDQSMDLSNEEKLQKEIIELKDKQIRLFAEFENYKKRTAKERIDLFRNAGLEFFEVHKAADVHHRNECELLLDSMTTDEQEKAEKAALSTAKYLWNFLTGMSEKHNLAVAA